MPDHDNSLDVLGIKPVADAVSTVTTAATAGAGAFLSRICLPAAEELGLLLQDKVRSWRAQNAVAIATKAEAKLQQLPNFQARHAHPRLVGAIIEHGSWADEGFVQEMWAGLLASACTEDGRNLENYVFATILAQLTPNQAQVLQFSCSNSKKTKSPSGLVTTTPLEVPFEEIIKLTGVTDVHQLDLELDHLRALGLIDIVSGLSPERETAVISLTAIALQLHMRAQGFVGSPLEFYRL